MAESKFAKFECSICMEVAREPVVTRCGHMYCWVCIREWLGQNRSTLTCPVCKAGISTETLIPVYTKEDSTDPRGPKRPPGERPQPVPNQEYSRPGGGIQFGIGFFPGVFFVSAMQSFGGGQMSDENSETLQQVFLVLAFLVFLISFFYVHCMLRTRRYFH